MPDHADRLELDLHGPMLDEFMAGMALYAEIRAIGQEIVVGYRGSVAKDTGDLADTARTVMHRTGRDRRWVCDVEIGNARVDYADIVEARDHTLRDLLAAMGYGEVEIF